MLSADGDGDKLVHVTGGGTRVKPGFFRNLEVGRIRAKNGKRNPSLEVVGFRLGSSDISCLLSGMKDHVGEGFEWSENDCVGAIITHGDDDKLFFGGLGHFWDSVSFEEPIFSPRSFWSPTPVFWFFVDFHVENFIVLRHD